MRPVNQPQVRPVLAAVADAVATASQPASTTIAAQRAFMRVGAPLTVADTFDPLVVLRLLGRVRRVPLEK